MRSLGQVRAVREVLRPSVRTLLCVQCVLILFFLGGDEGESEKAT